MRMEQLEVTQNKRQNAWQQFQTSKGRAKKVLLTLLILQNALFNYLIDPTVCYVGHITTDLLANTPSVPK